MKWLLVLSLLVTAALAQRFNFREAYKQYNEVSELPEYLQGTYNYVQNTCENEGFDKYMDELDVDPVTKGFACFLGPTQEIFQDDEGFVNINTATFIISTNTKFRLGKMFEETPADGKKARTLPLLFQTPTGHLLVKYQLPAKDSARKPTLEERWFYNDNKNMTLFHYFPYIPKTQLNSTRIYTRED